MSVPYCEFCGRSFAKGYEAAKHRLSCRREHQAAENGRYVIAAQFKDDDGGPLFWSNEHGWTSLSDATVFTMTERKAFNLPIEAYDFVELPS